MEWLRAHPYVSVIAGAAILIIAGAILVESRAPVAPISSSITWSGGTPISSYSNESAGQQSPQQIAQEVVQGQGENVTLPDLTVSPSQASQPGSGTEISGSVDYLGLLQDLVAPSGQRPASNANASSESTIAEAYEFIPQGLIATAPASPKPMTAAQQALYDYGNQVGGEIQSFEELHTNETEIIKDQAEDRTDPTKAAAVVSLGQALAGVGKFMEEMQGVPTSIQPDHEALAQSYLDIGAKLQLVPQAQTDQAFVQAIGTYDTSANTFVKNYAALAQFFTEQGVTFSSQDPGSVFSFSGSGGGL